MAKPNACLLGTVARAILGGGRGDLRAQLDTPHPVQSGRRPAFPAAAPADTSPASAGEPVAMKLSNGLGGFTDAGREYAVVLEGDQETPLPWANVIANANFGTVVTASGSAHTWSENSRENRLTSFANDPIVDPTAEALFIRDDDSGDAWSPTPGPMKRRPTSGQFVIRHAAGVTRFSRATRQIRHELEVFVDVADPVKFSLLTLTNDGDAPRRLSLFAYNDWVLGPPRDSQAGQITTTYDEQNGTICARNGYSDEFPQRIAFARASDRPCSATGHRLSFIGRNGSLARPDALRHLTLEPQFGAGLDPCAVLHLQVVLAPGESHRILFVIGQGTDREHVERLVARHGTVDAGVTALERVQASWRTTLDTIQVRTPDDSFDVLINQWLVYQDVSCRLWTRAGYYQPGGAFGFRDQLQDVLALLSRAPISPEPICSGRRAANSSKATSSTGGTSRAAAVCARVARTICSGCPTRSRSMSAPPATPASSTSRCRSSKRRFWRPTRMSPMVSHACRPTRARSSTTACGRSTKASRPVRTVCR